MFLCFASILSDVVKNARYCVIIGEFAYMYVFMYVKEGLVKTWHSPRKDMASNDLTIMEKFQQGHEKLRLTIR